MTVAAKCPGCGMESAEDYDGNGQCHQCFLKAQTLNGSEPSDVGTPIERFAALLSLPKVARARIVGRGSRASADIYLADGTTITFESLAEFADARKLNLEIACTTGANPKVDKPKAMEALLLLRQIAAHEETVSDDDLAVEWGRGFLQEVSIVDVDMSDQGERWGAFSKLSTRDDPAVYHHVLRDLNGNRYVRCGWFQDYVRRQDQRASESVVAHRMARVGWERRGRSGQIKATRPAFKETLSICFYIVPKGWEER
jgi:hypothetical protein